MKRLPDQIFRLRDRRELQSDKMNSLEGILVYLLPLHPWVAPGLRVFGHSNVDRQSLSESKALMSFDATIASYTPERRLKTGNSCKHENTEQKAPRSGLAALQHLRINQPFFRPLKGTEPES